MSWTIVQLDLFGGKVSQVKRLVKGFENAINVDIIAIEGVQADARHLPFAANSVDVIIASNPYIAATEDRLTQYHLWLRESARVLKPNGDLIVNGTLFNVYFDVPDVAVLNQVGLKLISQPMALDTRFHSIAFYRTNGSQINIQKMQTIIYRKG